MYGQKSNIAVFTLAYQPFEGGAEIAVREIITRMPLTRRFSIFTYRFDQAWKISESGSRNTVSIIRLGKGKKNRDHSTRLYYGRLSEKIYYVFAAWLAAERQHAIEPFTGVWAIMASYGGLAALLFKVRHPRIPFLLTLQEGDDPNYLQQGRWGLVGFLMKRIIKKADYIQAISNYLADMARRLGARSKITVIPNGVDIDQWKAVEASEEKIIVSASRLVSKNGIDILIRALALLKQRGISMRCIVIGDGPDRDALSELSTQLDLHNIIQFTGQLPHTEVIRYFHRAYIFVRPSRSEGLGNAFLEAMAAGLITVGTAVGGIPDFLSEGVTGFLVPPDNAEALADKLEYIVHNEIQARNVARQGNEFVQRYEWQIIAQRFEEVFAELHI